MLTNKFVSKFKKDIKKYQHQISVLDELDIVIKLLLAKKKSLKNIAITPFMAIMSECVNATLSLVSYWSTVSMKNVKFYIWKELALIQSCFKQKRSRS